MKFPWSYRYRAVIVGQESGNRTPVPFMRFRTEHDAWAWCQAKNLTDTLAADLDPLTAWEYEPC